MPDILVPTEQGEETVNIEFYCSECNKGICNNYNSGCTKGRSQPYFTAEPCSCQTDKIEELEAKIKELEKELDYAQRD